MEPQVRDPCTELDEYSPYILSYFVKMHFN
jgi:hypothetical protein